MRCIADQHDAPNMPLLYRDRVHQPAMDLLVVLRRPEVFLDAFAEAGKASTKVM